MADPVKSILHIEDDSDFHMYVDAMLSDVAKVTSVYTRKEAEKLLVGSIFDLFVLDLVLKDSSGSILAKDLKQAYPDTPIIILSAHNVTGAIDEAEASFVKSKLDEEGFITTVRKLLA